MPNEYGPSRGELMFRLWISLAGLTLLVAALAIRGWPSGPAMFEVVGIAGVFFGGTLFWTVRQLLRLESTEEE